MSRIQSRKLITQIPEGQKPKNYLIDSTLKLLRSFMNNKQRKLMAKGFKKIKQHSKSINQRNKMLNVLIGSLFTRKNKINQQISFRCLIVNQRRAAKQQIKNFEAHKLFLKQKSATLLGIIYKKLNLERLKATYKTLSIKSRIHASQENFRVQRIFRLCKRILYSKYFASFQMLIYNKNISKKSDKGVKKLFNLIKNVRTKNLFSSFCEIIRKYQKHQKKHMKPKEESKQKPYFQKKEGSFRYQQTDEKNQTFYVQIERIQRERVQSCQQFKQQIVQLQGEYQSLKFNNGILQGTIQDLQTELLQRHRKMRKHLNITDFWQRVYLNLLYLIRTHPGQNLPRINILQSLQTPLVPINIDIDSLKQQNNILQELLDQYKEFYQSKYIEDNGNKINLSYDLMVSKNSFLYLSMESLIHQGVANQSELNDPLKSIKKSFRGEIQSVTSLLVK